MINPNQQDSASSPGNTSPPPAPGYPVPNPIPPTRPNPGLAALLGFIPGVGAMYNGQYVKGILHLIVFTVLISLTDVSGLFGLFIAGWEFYMAFDAHHTAKARLEGSPLPNPFGFNDIGERLGFGKSWPGGIDVAGAARDAAQTVTQGFSNQPNPAAAQQTAQQAAWQASQQQYADAFYEQGRHDAGMPPFTSQPYTPVNPNPTPEPSYPMPPIQPSPLANTPLSRFPAGAAWLIGLGLLFLLFTTGRFNAFAIHGFLGFLLVGLGVWSFLRRMTETGQSLANDGDPLYTVRLVRALRGGFWLTLVGVWFLLDSFNILPFHRSWPIFLIAAGIIALLERLSANATAAAYLPPQPPYGTPVPPYYPPPAAPSTAIIPVGSDDLEKGR